MPSKSSSHALNGTLSSLAPAPTTMTSPPRRASRQAARIVADLPTTSKA